MKTLLSRAALAAAAMALCAPAAHATITNTTMTVKLTVLQACSVSADASLDFGDRFASAGTSDATAKVHVSCAASTMSLYLTSSNACTGGGRCMKSDANSVKYDLFTAAGADAVNLWPTTGQSVSSGDVTIYGRAYLTGAAAGAYTDTLTVALSY